VDKIKVIAIVGPTGSGKTKISIELSKKLDGEIISGDSMQVYRKMDIGTAKIKEDEKEGIPHYLLDIQEYSRPYNVCEFQKKCREAIETIHQKGKLPIICGGTGLYLKAALYDYTFQEEQKDEAYRQELETKTNEELYQLLKEIDPKSLDSIHVNNRKRVIRALEIAHSGKNKSAIEEAQNHEPIYDVLWIGLDIDREKLVEKIDERVDQMFEEGLEQEVVDLFSSPRTWEYTSFQGIGYKEFKPYFLKEASLESVKEKIKIHTRQYAKRQMTWFSRQVPVHWFASDQIEKIVEKVRCWLNA
jgi:tRNA dimethylallyltransferase